MKCARRCLSKKYETLSKRNYSHLLAIWNTLPAVPCWVRVATPFLNGGLSPRATSWVLNIGRLRFLLTFWLFAFLGYPVLPCIDLVRKLVHHTLTLFATCSAFSGRLYIASGVHLLALRKFPYGLEFDLSNWTRTSIRRDKTTGS